MSESGSPWGPLFCYGARADARRIAVTDRLILVGQVAGGFGVKGEVRVTAYTADPLALTAYGPLLCADGSIGLTLTTARPDKNGVVGRAKEIAAKEQADALRGLKLYVPRDRFPEPDEDEFYLADLIGLEARDGDDAVIGRVKSVQNFGASDMLEIAPASGGQTWYLPFTREAAPEVRTAQGWVRVIRPAEVGEPEPG
ncbi:MAG: 16S rRNA processing protein RimM [Caulobacterales bacterium]|nr:16S rRNA processing protein RimM [Caulobacterales bacterium]